MTPGRLKIWNDLAGEWQYTPGGSQPGTLRRLDLGVVDASDVQTDSVVLYTPAAGEVVGPLYITDVTLTDTFGLAVQCSDGDSVNVNGLAAVTTSIYYAGIVTPSNSVGRVQLATTPIIAGCTEDAVDQPVASAWQANHHYVPDPVTSETLVVAAGHLWLNTTDGDSGNSTPDFAGNTGGSVVDNDLTWTDEGALPSQGSMHVYADVTTPVAP